MRNAGGGSGSGGGGISRTKFEQLAPRKRGGKYDLWVCFWSLADNVGEHYVWRGTVDRHGAGVFTPNEGPAVPASHVAWAYDGRELAARERLQVSCGRKGCVRAEHQAVRSAR